MLLPKTPSIQPLCRPFPRTHPSPQICSATIEKALGLRRWPLQGYDRWSGARSARFHLKNIQGPSTRHWGPLPLAVTPKGPGRHPSSPYPPHGPTLPVRFGIGIFLPSPDHLPYPKSVWNTTVAHPSRPMNIPNLGS